MSHHRELHGRCLPWDVRRHFYDTEKTASESRDSIDGLGQGNAYTLEEADWDLITELIGVDLKEFDCDYEDYIMGRLHETTFIKGDVKFDGNCSTRELPVGRDGFEPPPEEYDAFGVVILGDLEVTGTLDLDELGPLFVSGNVKAGTITNCYGTLVAGGSIQAKLIYCISADEGGMIHTEDCQTELFIDGSGSLDYHCAGDYPFLFASHYSPRERYTLERALEELGFGNFGMEFSAEILELTYEEGQPRIGTLIELVERLRHASPPNVPAAAEWTEEYPAGYRLQETNEDDQPHGVEGLWAADGTVRHLAHYKDGEPHGEWIVERNGQMRTRYFVDGEPRRPDGVPEEAVWKEDDWQWELAPTDDDGQMDGLVRWWRPDGTLVCETPYEHGVPTGEGRRYHESGEVSQTYMFVDGKLHGERTWYPTDTETSESATQGFADNVARVVGLYKDGNQVEQARFYDADGNELDSYGRPVS